MWTMFKLRAFGCCVTIGAVVVALNIFHNFSEVLSVGRHYVIGTVHLMVTPNYKVLMETY